MWAVTATFIVTDVLEGELRAPEPGEPGDPGEPGLREAEGGGLDRLVLVEPEKASLKLGFCLPEKLDFARISLSSGSFTAYRSEILGSQRSHLDFFKHEADCTDLNYGVGIHLSGFTKAPMTKRLNWKFPLYTQKDLVLDNFNKLQIIFIGYLLRMTPKVY